MDPFSGLFKSKSPYLYCTNNPLNLIDPDGRAYHDLYNDKIISGEQAFDYLMEVLENILVGNSADNSNKSSLNFYSTKDWQDYFTDFKVIGWRGAETDISPFGNFDFYISIIVNTAFKDELKINLGIFQAHIINGQVIGNLNLGMKIIFL